MRRLAVILIGICLTLAAQAQGGQTFTTSGGLTVTVPERYLAAEVGPLRVGLTDRETGASVLFGLVDSTQQPDDALAAELRRLGVGSDQVQLGALSARAERGRISGARAVRASGTMMIASVAFADGTLGLLTIQPADSVPLPTLKALVDSVRVARHAGGDYPLCGSDALPQALTTSGGLSVCFPAGFAGEEKGANAAGIANLADGVIISIYARADLAALTGSQATDAPTAAAAFASTVRAAGANPVESAAETIRFSGGSGIALPVAYPGVGSGRVIVIETGGQVAIVSAVLLGLPPANIVGTLNAISNSVTLHDPSPGLGEVRTAEKALDLGIAAFTVAPGWSVVSLDGGLATVEREDGAVLMSVAAAPLDSGWNADAYAASVLPAAAQFAGDMAYEPATLELIPWDGNGRISAYDSSMAVPDGTAAVNLTVLVTVEGRALIVYQANAARAAYSTEIRDEILQMARSTRGLQ